MGLLSNVGDGLDVLGPVGFYLAHRVGPRALFALGIGWPALLGTASTAWALRRFTRSDVI
jgi:hypothetical protein